MNEIIQRPMVPQSRIPQSRVSGEDPLAELARIVGNRPQAGGRNEPRFADASHDGYADHDEQADERAWHEDQDSEFYAGEEQAGEMAAQDQDLAEDELYDDTELHQDYALAAERPAPPVRQASRAGGMVAIAGLLLMAVAGGGAALAWKSGLLSSVALPGGPAPLIHASTDPVKVTPAPAVADDGSAAAKEIFDRAGKSVSPAQVKVVSREEQPLALPATSSEPVAPPKLSSMPSVGSTTVASTEEIDLTGPRKVKTIKILADGRAAPDAVPVRRAAVAAISMPAPTANDADTTASMDDVDAAPAAAPEPVVQSPVRAKAPKVADQDGDDAQPAARSQPIPQPKPAALGKAAPAKAAPAKPVQVASLAEDEPAPASSGGFVVQVASQKTEADAAATFKRLQGRFGSLLGGMKPSIRKAELGDKGTFYRIRVGPMASRDSAVDLCVKLKAAGGSCVVAKD